MSWMDMEAVKEARGGFLRDLQEAQGRVGIERLLSHHVLERIPAIFNGNYAAWIDWKSQLSEGLSVDPLSMVLVGGAALGFSPIKDLHFFRPTSDVDVAIISPRHFDAAWHKMRSYNHCPPEMHHMLEEHRTRYIYWGVIATDIMLACFEFGDLWKSELEKLRENPATRDREVNVRIYRDPASLRTYQVAGLTKTQRNLRKKRFREALSL